MFSGDQFKRDFVLWLPELWEQSFVVSLYVEKASKTTRAVVNDPAMRNISEFTLPVERKASEISQLLFLCSDKI